jgi:hypothetical protein
MLPKTALLAMLVLVLGTAGGASTDTAFSAISTHYEVIRQALMKDSAAGVREHARAIQLIASGLSQDFSAASAGVAEPDARALREVLPEIIECSGALAAADGLTAVRTAFAELTMPLVRYHRLVQGARPVVAYCPMAKKSWLQPDEAIGNPYVPSMLRCGEVVQR